MVSEDGKPVFIMDEKWLRDEPLLPSNQGAKVGATWKFLKLWGKWGFFFFFLDCPKPRGQQFLWRPDSLISRSVFTTESKTWSWPLDSNLFSSAVFRPRLKRTQHTSCSISFPFLPFSFTCSALRHRRRLLLLLLSSSSFFSASSFPTSLS